MSLRLFNIPPDVAFLPALTRAILAGNFPADLPPPSLDELPRWTILLPTRRAVRILQRSFLTVAGREAMLLPRIRPIGDVEEDLLVPDDSSPADDLLAPAISALEREALLIRLIDEWVVAYPDERLSREIAGSPSQAIALAESLSELVDTFETEEADLAKLSDLFAADLAEHRTAILGFLAIVRERLPHELETLGLLGPMERRSRLLRLEAKRLAELRPESPIIVAGSTGSIPAASELMKTIAALPNGAVVLPGLDQTMSEEAWQHVSPQHPQFGLKRLLDSWNQGRSDVRPLPGIDDSPRNPARSWLASEIMRPTAAAGSWREALFAGRDEIVRGMAGVSLIERADHHQEAQTIALIMREVLEEPGKTAALVTPDRDLARRVVSALKRWGVEIDDSAGVALNRRPMGSLLSALIDYRLSDFAIHEFAKLLHHPLAIFGQPPEAARKAAGIIDLALLRSGLDRLAPDAIVDALVKARREAETDIHTLMALKRLSEPDWALAQDQARAASAALASLMPGGEASLAQHAGVFTAALEHVADRTADAPAAEAIDLLVQSLAAAERFLPECGPERAALFLAGWLRRLPVRLSVHHPRLSILGLLEARLINPDVVIMGGLTEASWPAQPDPGPWINRPMRESLGMTPPERSIGLTAHDFAQGLGAPKVVLTWSKRVKEQPAVASRWILRLRMILEATGTAFDDGAAWRQWARTFDDARGDRRVVMPRPRPPVAARPRSLSITQVEKLMRDPYRIYAEKVLRLEPLPPIGAAADLGLRGNLIHDTLNLFSSAYPVTLPVDAESELKRLGSEVFAPHMADADVAGFWWPRFLRIVPWFVAEERNLRQGLLRIHAEVAAAHEFDGFTLTGRADRIDIMASGKARLIDYKTGRIPTGSQVKTGLAPQLTLEAALLAAGSFKGVEPAETEALLYIKLSGGAPPGLLQPIADLEIMEKAQEHLEKFKALIRAYDDVTKGYLPRAAMEKEQDTSPFDHLSRWREWSLAEDAS
ncbi:double-strand break repair protein AddB [Nordella sp. HKS 07]|uniref:double-strand break repair protein AddB n=1 Tax=Nordella sp. HKS 07 TaxID=2712222 RepID=UPI0013E1F644|nr:double-strand break repair protein AddB [Nordella sp. HKS 07]QIG48682.1 double-strand break repair protein AddB [Nordella sp. HKS 07]